MVNPFLGVYAVNLGASSADMGWFQSSANISNNLMQVFWGSLSDRFGKRIPFIVLGGLIVSALWIPMTLATNAAQLIILVAVQALLGSMATPAWTALIGDLVPASRFGRANASVFLWTSVGGLVATLASGTLMVVLGGTPQQMFLIPLTVAAACGIASSLVMLYLKERKNGVNTSLKKRLTSDIFSMLTNARKTPDFARYCYVSAVFEFFMSMSWPLIPITQWDILKATMLHIALLSVVQTFLTIMFQGWAGRLADTRGRKPLLLFFRFSLLTVPVAYAFAPDMNALIVMSTFWGVSFAVGQASITAYLLDLAPAESRGGFIAVYNLTIGVSTFFGSLIGGYLANYLVGVYGIIAGLQIVYMVSLAGRGVGALAQLTLKETLKTP